MIGHIGNRAMTEKQRAVMVTKEIFLSSRRGPKTVLLYE